METRRKIKSFTDLIVWQKGHLLVVEIYKLTKNFPKDELFTLVSQMRRSAISVTSNIAEGFCRKGLREKQQFYFIASGSLSELKNQLIVARDVGYLREGRFQTTCRHGQSNS